MFGHGFDFISTEISSKGFRKTGLKRAVVSHQGGFSWGGGGGFDCIDQHLAAGL